MAQMKDIRKRIGTVKNIQQITRAMKIVAATKLRKAQEAVLAARPYALALRDTLSTLEALPTSSLHPLLCHRTDGKEKPEAVVIVTADRGLCGSFNANVLRHAENYCLENPSNKVLFSIGRKGKTFFRRRDFKVEENYEGVLDHLTFSFPSMLAEKLTREYLEGKWGRVQVIYNEFKSALAQEVVIETFLPVVPSTELEKRKLHIVPFFEPKPKVFLEEIVPRHFAVQFWRVLLESSAAEHAARMTSMENATKNAGEMIDQLTLDLNRVRQAAITKELAEIVGGAEALK